MSKPKSYAYETMGRLNMKVKRCHLWWIIVDTIKRLLSYLKCRSVKVINNLAKPGSNYREVNCINYK